jgi:thiol-disulfide isomerase/thioredoxin
MRSVLPIFLLASVLTPALAQDTAGGPTDEKAKKSYTKGLDDLKTHNALFALDEFKKADKQDGGHCRACQKQMIKYGMELGEWKTAEQAVEEMIADTKEPKDVAIAHYQFAVLLIAEGKDKHKQEIFSRAHEEAVKALTAYANFPEANYVDGTALAYLGQDDAAKAKFEEFAKAKPAEDPTRQRAIRFINRPELVRAKMAPPFGVTTMDGRKISMDDLQGKVVLLDFWATWCAPCREALPHIRNVAKKFKDEPLVILSVSLDGNEQQWKDFIGKNEMTWLQYRDGGFTGPVSRLFSVTAIPHTFTIDADGVLQEEHIGDASIEGKLKKLIVRARELQAPQSSVAK